VVYKARDQKLKRIVALKMILSGSHASEDDMQRFQTEAEAVARLQHPNIVQIYEVSEHEGCPYLALEFAEGGNLDKKIAGTPQNANESAQLVETLAQAMQLAHDNDVIHRDLKPANILLTADGEPRITDFGLAKRMDDDSNQTKSGAVMGTPSYMAPEQAASSSSTLGAGADIYALGAILYHMLTGRPPFQAETQLDTIMQLISDEPVPPRKLNRLLPVDLETICLKCLEKDVHRRYESAEALAKDLRRFQTGEPIQARPVSVVTRGLKWAKRRPAIAGLISVSVIAVAVVITSVLLFNRELRFERNLAENRRIEAVVQKRAALQQRALAALREEEAQKAREEADNQKKLAIQQTEKAVTAEAEALTLRGEAELAEIEAKQLLAYAHVESGARFLRDGDTAQALDWFSRAQQVDQLDQHKNQIAVLRTWNTLLQTPKVVKIHVETARSEGNDGGGFAFLNPSLEALGAMTGKPLGVYAALHRESGRVLARFDDQVGGSKDLVRLWDYDPVAGEASGDTESPPATMLQSHVRHVVFSPDGKRFAVNRLQGTGNALLSLFGGNKPSYLLDVYDAETFKLLYSQKWPDLLWFIVFDPTGQKMMVRDSSDRNVHLLDVETGEKLGVMETTTDEAVSHQVYRAAFHPDGSRIISIGYGSIRTWKVGEQIEVETTVKHGVIGHEFAVDPEGAYAAVGSREGIVVVDLDSGEVNETRLLLKGDTSDHNMYNHFDVMFSPGGEFLLAYVGRTVQVWERETWKPVIHGIEHDGDINHVSFNPEGLGFLSCSDDGWVRIWDVKSGGITHSPFKHEGPVSWADFDMDGRKVVSLSSYTDYQTRQATLRTWDLATSIALSRSLRHQREVLSTSFDPDGTTVLTCGVDGRIVLWDADSGTNRLAIQLEEYPRFAWFVENGTRIMTQTNREPRKTQFWDSTTGKEIAPEIIHTEGSSRFSLSSDGRQLLVAGDDNILRMWDTHTGEELFEAKPQVGTIARVHFVDNSAKYVVMRDSAPTALITLMDTKTHEKIWQSGSVNMREAETKHMLFSPRGDRFAVSVELVDKETDNPRTIYFLHDMETGKRVAHFDIAGEAAQAKFTPDGKRLCVADTVGKVYMVNTETGREAVPPLFHEGGVNFLSFSPDGLLMVTAFAAENGGGGVQVWDVATGHPVTPPIVAPGGEAELARFSPDGESVLVRQDGAKEVVLYQIAIPEGTEAADILAVARALAAVKGKDVEESPVTEEAEHELSAELWASLTSPSPRAISTWHGVEADRASRNRQWEWAATHLAPMVALDNDWNAYAQRAWFHVLNENIEQASQDYLKAIELDLPPGARWYNAASALLVNEDYDAYRRLCTLGLERLETQRHQVFDKNGLTQASFLLPDTFETYDAVLKHTIAASSEHSAQSPAPYSLYCRGGALFRSGAYKTAKRVLEESLIWRARVLSRDDDGNYGDDDMVSLFKLGQPRQIGETRKWLLLAMCEFHLDNNDRATEIHEFCRKYRDRWNLSSSFVFVQAETDRYMAELEELLEIEPEVVAEDK
jgi:WD40 repeat protein/tRNA A-37 threonylcarbamoyl transferase component Bud32